MNTRHDWETLKKEWVAGRMSLRAHARANGVVESSMVDRARKDGWQALRDKYQLSLTAATIDGLVQKQADDLLRTRGKAIKALEEAFDRFTKDLHRTRTVKVPSELDDDGKAVAWKLEQVPVLIVQPAQIGVLIDKVNVLMGQPASITRQEGEAHIDITADLGNLPADLLAGLAEIGSRLGADAGAVGTPALPRIEDPGPSGDGA